MRKREIVFAALAASMLSAGSAHALAAGTSCMDTCNNTFGSAIIVYHKSTGTSEVRELSGCETSYDYVNGTATTTCTYTSSAA
ncbi:hypothetical protein [Longimicrobium sp.]|uniref:hypothetical protein n=1 Tax=Longimicrobium sp. TaxID=2029185 RepID=UPI002E3641B0|nr:hypothetical protein [Longimicrobium sp.]HEX6036820.1 hypothetical protein [Longimicrobium sp.]